jgi:hypothetical protein
MELPSVCAEALIRLPESPYYLYGDMETEAARAGKDQGRTSRDASESRPQHAASSRTYASAQTEEALAPAKLTGNRAFRMIPPINADEKPLVGFCGRPLILFRCGIGTSKRQFAHLAGT